MMNLGPSRIALLVLLAAVAASLTGCIFEGGAGGPFM
jgi:hypothetical protein